ncbi:hypothetical protein BBJ28_00021604 [Nothophytophthora sp. Chile5]|nr:hypothetical protein BBJ28_00021604 [Nothophytophthora sp. Chile5]
MKNGLVLGLDGAGKTLLLRQLTAQLVREQKSVLARLAALASSTSGAASSSTGAKTGTKNGDVSVDPATQPTVGVEHWPLPLDGGRTCTLCEVGAQLLPMWPAYFESCDFWLFLVDASNPVQLAGAAVELFAVLGVEEMRRKPKLLVVNHIDADWTVDDAALRTYLCLDRLLTDPEAGPVQTLKVSALTGENVEQVLKWLSFVVTSSQFRPTPGLTLSISGRYRTAGRQLSSTEVRVHPITQ